MNIRLLCSDCIYWVLLCRNVCGLNLFFFGGVFKNLIVKLFELFKKEV